MLPNLAEEIKAREPSVGLVSIPGQDLAGQLGRVDEEDVDLEAPELGLVVNLEEVEQQARELIRDEPAVAEAPELAQERVRRGAADVRARGAPVAPGGHGQQRAAAGVADLPAHVGVAPALEALQDLRGTEG